MVEAPDRLHEAIDRAKTSREITAREIDAMARHIARKEVQQRWREQGHKRYDHSFKELCEAADAVDSPLKASVRLGRVYPNDMVRLRQNRRLNRSHLDL